MIQAVWSRVLTLKWIPRSSPNNTAVLHREYRMGIQRSTSGAFFPLVVAAPGCISYHFAQHLLGRCGATRYETGRMHKIDTLTFVKKLVS